MNEILTTADEFINFFEAIPDEKWCTQEFLNASGQSCAYGQLGARPDQPWPMQCQPLTHLIKANFGCGVISISDGSMNCPLHIKTLPTPKARILAALHEIKSHQEKE